MKNYVAKEVFAKVVMVLVLAFGISNAAQAETSPSDLALRLFKRLAVHANGGDARLSQMAALIAVGDHDSLIQAAHIATADHNFGNVTLFNYFAPMTNTVGSSIVPLNDAILFGIATAWLDRDYREIVNGDNSYSLNAVGLSAVSLADNVHYQNAYDKNVDFVASLATPIQQTFSDRAGMMTTRQWLTTYAKAGTNRKMVQYGYLYLLGINIQSIRTLDLSTDRVNHDVSRNPGNDPNQFHTACATCHTHIDPMRSAFNGFDGTNVTPTLISSVVPKIIARNDDANGFVGFTEGAQPEGFNGFKVYNYSSLVGWNKAGRDVIAGNGAKQLGTEWGNTNAFALNAVNQVWKLVCSDTPTDAATMQTLADYFKSTLNYKLRALFEEISTRQECLGI